MQRLLTAGLIATGVLTSGCGTLAAKGVNDQWGRPYSGVRADGTWIKCGAEWMTYDLGEFPEMLVTVPLGLFALVGGIIDAPLSAVLDTLVVPIDWAVTLPPPETPSDCAL